ncbi:MAG: hypothetical protein DCC67_17400 [Planctomycetota bacterium]|nr:MAG: hypothetical protein DCC67_17400 [Planctomycetota bacterium]
MIKRFVLLAAALGTLGAQAAYAQTSASRGVPPRRALFNPFTPFASGRILVGRFGLPRFQPLALPSDETTAPASSQPPLPTVASAEGEEVIVQAAVVRPPYRPPVRSPYRPPPRPPF